MNKSYTKGRRIEFLAKKKLEAEGYLVIRSAASKGPVDLVAINSVKTRLIQVKARKPTRRQMQNLQKLVATGIEADVEVWIYKGKGVFDKKVIELWI